MWVELGFNRPLAYAVQLFPALIPTTYRPSSTLPKSRLLLEYQQSFAQGTLRREVNSHGWGWEELFDQKLSRELVEMRNDRHCPAG
jgi:hypothetical protein